MFSIPKIASALLFFTTATKDASVSAQTAYVNPDRGFLHHAETTTTSLTPLTQSYVNSLTDVSLIRRLYYLDAFKTANLSSTFLTTVQQDFALLGSAGKRAVLRFAYGADDANDPAESVILNHLDQLRPVLGQIAKSLLAFEAGFVGKWGEWYYTNTYGDAGVVTAAQMQSRYKFVRSMADSVGADVPIAVRWTGWAQQLTAIDATLTNRLTIYDDCIYAPWNDLGTFNNGVESVSSYQFGAGGETCSSSYAIDTTNTCAGLITALARINATYVNLDYYQPRLQEYTACNYANRLGYAIETRSKTVQCSASSCTVAFDLVNTGFARPARAKTLSLKCGSATTQLSVNFRQLFPGTTTHVSATVAASSCASPTLYILDTQFPTTAGYSVKLANAQSFDATTGANVLQ